MLRLLFFCGGFFPRRCRSFFRGGRSLPSCGFFPLAAGGGFRARGSFFHGGPFRRRLFPAAGCGGRARRFGRGRCGGFFRFGGDYPDPLRNRRQLLFRVTVILGFVQIGAADRAQSLAVRAVQGARRLVDQQIFPDQRFQVEMRVLADGQQRIGCVLRRVNEQIFEVYGNRSGEFPQATGAFGRDFAAEFSLRYDTLRGSAEDDVTGEVFDGNFIADGDLRLAEVEFSAISCCLAEEETYVQSKRAILCMHFGKGLKIKAF
jgi:hypothetical protein